MATNNGQFVNPTLWALRSAARRRELTARYGKLKKVQKLHPLGGQGRANLRRAQPRPRRIATRLTATRDTCPQMLRLAAVATSEPECRSALVGAERDGVPADDVAHEGHALAALRPAAEPAINLGGRARRLVRDRADLAVGEAVAETNVHGARGGFAGRAEPYCKCKRFAIAFFPMYAWRHLDRRLSAGLLQRLADPRRQPPRWLEQLGLRPDFYWPFVF